MRDDLLSQMERFVRSTGSSAFVVLMVVTQPDTTGLPDAIYS